MEIRGATTGSVSRISNAILMIRRTVKRILRSGTRKLLIKAWVHYNTYDEDESPAHDSGNPQVILFKPPPTHPPHPHTKSTFPLSSLLRVVLD